MVVDIGGEVEWQVGVGAVVLIDRLVDDAKVALEVVVAVVAVVVVAVEHSRVAEPAVAVDVQRAGYLLAQRIHERARDVRMQGHRVEVMPIALVKRH